MFFVVKKKSKAIFVVGIAVMGMNRPDARNAMSKNMCKLVRKVT